MLTLGEFKKSIGDAPDDTPLTVLMSDGNLDYALFVWRAGPGEETGTDDDKLAIVIVPN